MPYYPELPYPTVEAVNTSPIFQTEKLNYFQFDPYNETTISGNESVINFDGHETITLVSPSLEGFPITDSRAKRIKGLIHSPSLGYRNALVVTNLGGLSHIACRHYKTKSYFWQNYGGVSSPDGHWKITGVQWDPNTGPGQVVTVWQTRSGAIGNLNFPLGVAYSGGETVYWYEGVYFVDSPTSTVEYGYLGGTYEREMTRDTSVIKFYAVGIDNSETLIGYTQEIVIYALVNGTLINEAPMLGAIGFFRWGSCGYDDLALSSQSYYLSTNTGVLNDVIDLEEYFHTYTQSVSSSYCFENKFCSCDDVLNGRYADLIKAAGEQIRPSPGSLL